MRQQLMQNTSKEAFFELSRESSAQNWTINGK